MASTNTVVVSSKHRISAEYLEMPGLRLTLTQASRLFGLDTTQCDTLLNGLVEEGFLVRHRDGSYARPGSHRFGSRMIVS
jgi:DNA-binding IclR family transcriptional regulator